MCASFSSNKFYGYGCASWQNRALFLELVLMGGSIRSKNLERWQQWNWSALLYLIAPVLGYSCCASWQSRALFLELVMMGGSIRSKNLERMELVRAFILDCASPWVQLLCLMAKSCSILRTCNDGWPWSIRSKNLERWQQWNWSAFLYLIAPVLGYSCYASCQSRALILELELMSGSIRWRTSEGDNDRIGQCCYTWLLAYSCCASWQSRALFLELELMSGSIRSKNLRRWQPWIGQRRFNRRW